MAKYATTRHLECIQGPCSRPSALQTTSMVRKQGSSHFGSSLRPFANLKAEVCTHNHCGDIAEKCEKLRNCRKLRKIADLIPPPRHTGPTKHTQDTPFPVFGSVARFSTPLIACMTARVMNDDEKSIAMLHAQRKHPPMAQGHWSATHLPRSREAYKGINNGSKKVMVKQAFLGCGHPQLA